MSTPNNRVSALAAGALFLLVGTRAHATTCIYEFEQASLHVLKVEVDGVEQTNLSAYAGFEHTLEALSDQAFMMTSTPNKGEGVTHWAAYVAGVDATYHPSCPSTLPVAGTACSVVSQPSRGEGYANAAMCGFAAVRETCSARCTEGRWVLYGCGG